LRTTAELLLANAYPIDRTFAKQLIETKKEEKEEKKEEEKEETLKESKFFVGGR
jgi:hypothetical protein